jgi:AmmeMemoRadiSam system protein B
MVAEAAAVELLRVRPAAVAGLFYPAETRALRSLVERLLAEARRPAEPPPNAVIAPHAGYLYSGPVAASAFVSLEPRAGSIRRVVLLGPSHRVPLWGLGLPAAEAFETPLGRVPVDAELASRAAALPQVADNAAAHAGEHSLEVELPFLQVLLGEFSLLPLVVGEATGPEVAEVLDAVWDADDTAIVISSDLSHYLPYEAARRVDGETAQAILALAGPISTERACGARPISGLLLAAARRGLVASLLDLRNSGDTAGGRREVVGYGAFAFRPGAGRA